MNQNNPFNNPLNQYRALGDWDDPRLADREYHDKRRYEAQMMRDAGPQPDFLGNPAPKKAEPNKVLLLLEN